MKWLAALLSLAHLPVAACEIAAAKVSYKKGTYEVAVEMLLEAPPLAVSAVITDHANLIRISDTFTESVLLSNDDERHSRRRLHINACVIFFCFDMELVEDVEIEDDGTIVTTIVPELSDFDSGYARWQINPDEDDGSRLHFSSKRQPDFWIPPLIGPYILKRKVIAETAASCHRIEAIAQESLGTGL